MCMRVKRGERKVSRFIEGGGKKSAYVLVRYVCILCAVYALAVILCAVYALRLLSFRQSKDLIT